MTWLYDKSTPARAVPVDLLADSLFAAHQPDGVQLLEFGVAGRVDAVAAVDPVPPEDPAAQEAQERLRQVRRMVDTAREEAAAEMRTTLEASCAERVRAEQGRVESVLAMFSEERARWFRQSEAEIVTLALAVAHRVLSRELRLDPMALREIAAEAIGRVQDGSGVVLRVAPAQVADWRGAFSSRGDLEVVADASVLEGDCRVETTFGRVELGVDVQMEEIAERFHEMVGGPRRVLLSERDGAAL